MNNKKHKIILASSSPRRKELLEGIGVKFFIDTSEVDETVNQEVPPYEFVEVLALRKAQVISCKYKEGIVIGSDTIVVLDSKILGKPKDDNDALNMLLSLQGRKHQVYSGLAIIDSSNGKHEVAHEVTDVYFRQIDKDEALRYISSGEPKGKAGSYAIQGLGALFVQGIKGDYFNVVGLPLFLLAKMLKKFEVSII